MDTPDQAPGALQGAHLQFSSVQPTAPSASSLPSPSDGRFACAGIAEVLDAYLQDYSRQVAATRGSQAALQASIDRLEVRRHCQVHADAVVHPCPWYGTIHTSSP